MTNEERNNYHLTKWECETIINFNEDEDVACIYTYNKHWIKKLEKLSEEYPDKFMFESSDLYGKFLSVRYKVDKNYIGLITPRKCTEERKEKQKEILVQARKKKSEQNSSQSQNGL